MNSLTDILQSFAIIGNSVCIIFLVLRFGGRR